jgi:hypothetical protein
MPEQGIRLRAFAVGDRGMRLRLVLAAVFVAALLAVPSAQAYVHYYGTVGPTATIFLKRGDGTNVTRAVHGLRTFVIRDRSAGHNFHLFGPGVDRRTGIALVGTRTWTPVRLRIGTYVFRCDAHPKTMRKTFVVY